MALPSFDNPSPLLDQLFSGKIRLKILARLLLNPSSQVYLRQLERDLNVSSNTVRLELNKLSEMKLISTMEEAEESKVKKYIANGKETPFIDLVMVGEFNKAFLFQLLERAEKLLNKKIRIALYSKNEFKLELLESILYASIYKSEMGGA